MQRRDALWQARVRDTSSLQSRAAAPGARRNRRKGGETIMAWWVSLTQTFLLAFSALFSIVNPLSAAIIFSQLTFGRSHAERLVLAKRIAGYAAAVMLSSLWFGVYLLNFFGVTLAALRIAGGFVVTAAGWQMLYAPELRQERKEAQAGEAMHEEDVAFFPLTMPMTTGPGTISVAIALGSNRPAEGVGLSAFLVGSSLAALAIAASIWFSYHFADRVVALLGRTRAQIVSRLAAFLLLCVGVQITLNGVLEALRDVGVGSR